MTILWEGPVADLDSKEIQLIQEHGTLRPNGYNILPGGKLMQGELGKKICSDLVRESWKRDDVQKRHSEARKAAWADETKRANIMNGRRSSSRVEAARIANKQASAEANAKRSATWESKRAERLRGLTGKKLKQRMARLNRDRERHRRKVRAKRG